MKKLWLSALFTTFMIFQGGLSMAIAKTPPKEIYLAGGCFWGLEAYMKNIKGVADTDVGYANGKDKAPSYEEVCTGLTGHAETVRIRYNPGEISVKRLLQFFLEIIDPTVLNRQGPDIGTQYRTGIYFTDADDEAVAREVLAEAEAHLNKPVVVEALPLINYFSAEEYHQDYLDKNPKGYCHIPRSLIDGASSLVNHTEEYRRPSDKAIKEKLSDMQYHVTMENGTEPAFQNKYWDHKEQGLYVDVVTGEPLFLSGNKYDSGCGWPSFTQPVESGSVKKKEDVSHGMVRTEVRSRSGNIHLGHVFDDGPKDRGGLRYCINSASLRFIPLEQMEQEGYGSWIDKVKASH